MITSLDLTKVPREQFSVAKASELYDDFIADNKVIPDKIYVRGYQLMILGGNGHLLEGKRWRGVLLEVR